MPIWEDELSTSLTNSYRYCIQLAQSRATNFYYSFLVLPRRQRRAMCALYAFMRLADDFADSERPREEKLALLQSWREDLSAALTGRFHHPLFPALYDVIQTYRLPGEYLFTLIDGVQSDLDTARFKSFDNLYSYCYRVASIVGLSCIRIWGCANTRAVKFAEYAGIAFQLTNILRDLREDALNGRVYIPQDELARFGCSESQLRDGPYDERFRELMRFQFQRAKDYYRMAQPLSRYLPPSGRAVFQVMMRIYRGLLSAAEQAESAWPMQRVRLRRRRKLGIVLQALPIRLGWL